MSEHKIDLINNRKVVAAGDTVKIINSNSLYFLIGAGIDDVTVSIQVIEDGDFRTIDPVIEAGKALQTANKIPNGAVVKFSAAAEVWAYA